MYIHKNARLTPVLREELARKVLGNEQSLARAAAAFKVSRNTAAKWVKRFQRDGNVGLLDHSSRPYRSSRRLSPNRSDDECKAMLLTVLHHPPSEFGINRTSWKLDDLHRVLAEQGCPVSQARMRRIIRSTGFKWRKAKIVLTSTDPEYTRKLEGIKRILATLKDDEAFFSIDEYGPFAIKKKGGRMRVGPAENYVVPQRQKSRGSLILTAALELSSNQVTHFYSGKKNTEEMIKMADLLRSQYSRCQRIYLSWDSASWHISKSLNAHLATLNSEACGLYPILETAPLPAGAQFLNVIESVFSGMAKAIIHNSDYSSTEAAIDAIDRYFQTRNAHFAKHPSRAGRKIWQMERVPCEFSESNNCKDPAYR
jgi:transposase